MRLGNSQPSRLRARYIDSQSGWQYFFFSVAIAAALGLSFRIYFSPERVREWVETVLERNDRTFSFDFSRAELRLAQASVPLFAVVLSDVKIAPSPTCRPEPSIEIAELTVPFRLSGMVLGKFAIGTITAADSVVDLDGVKVRCDGAGEESVSVTAPTPDATTGLPAESSAKAWWTEKQYADAKNMIDGINLSRVELQFENKTKRVFLDAFQADFETKGGQEGISVSTEVVFPPEVTYGEKVPPLVLDIFSTSERAEIDLLAEMNEGELQAHAVLTPGTNETPNVDLDIALSDLPLSTLLPLLQKASIVTQEFKPKFLWFDCRLKVAGPFQGLFEASPVQLQACTVKGEGMNMTIPSAKRFPSGKWEPFEVALGQVDVGKLLQTLDVEGPSGIASRFGDLIGKVTVRTEDDATFRGTITNAKLIFSNRNVRAEQIVPAIDLEFVVTGGKITGHVDRVVVKNGEMKGKMQFEFDRGFKNGRVKADIATLTFDPQIQRLMINGTMGSLSGSGEAVVKSGALDQLEAKVKLGQTQGEEFRLIDAEIEGSLGSSRTMEFKVTAPSLELNRGSSFFEAMKAVLLEQQVGAGEWLTLRKVGFRAFVPEGGGVRWSHGKAVVENDRIGVTTEGAMSREKKLFGWVEVDYPLAKKLRWAVAGTVENPVLTENSAALKELRKRKVDASTLGLKK